MRADAHVSVVPATVHAHALRRYEAARLHGGRALFVASPMGAPRRWAPLRESCMAAFEASIMKSPPAPGGERLRGGMHAATLALSAELERSIELRDADVAALGGLIHRGRLYLARAGDARVYLHRGGRTERLTPRDEPSGGLLEADAWEHEVALEPADIILFGSTTAFSKTSTAKVAAVLGKDQNVPLGVLAELLTEPAESAGHGAAAIVLRVR